MCLKKKLTDKEINSILYNKMKNSEGHCINQTDAKQYIKDAGDYRAKRTIGDIINNEWYGPNKSIYINSNDIDFPKEIKRSDKRETYYTFRMITDNKRIENIDKLINSDRFPDAKKVIENTSNYSSYEIKELFRYIDEIPDLRKLEIYLAVSRTINNCFELLPIYEYDGIISQLGNIVKSFDIFSNYEKLYKLYDVHNKTDYELSLNLTNKKKSEKLRLELSQISLEIVKENMQINNKVYLKKEILNILSKCNKSTLIFKYFISDVTILINYLIDFLKKSKSIEEKFAKECKLVPKELTEKQEKLYRYYEIRKAIIEIYSTDDLIKVFTENKIIYDYEMQNLIINNSSEITDEIIELFNKIIKYNNITKNLENKIEKAQDYFRTTLINGSK